MPNNYLMIFIFANYSYMPNESYEKKFFLEISVP